MTEKMCFWACTQLLAEGFIPRKKKFMAETFFSIQKGKKRMG